MTQKMNIATMRCISILIFFIITQCAFSSRISRSDSFQCVNPRLINGRIRVRGRGKIIRYSCYAQYELVGNKYSTCIRGSWDTPTPICVSTRCPAIPVPKHAVVGEKYRGAILMYLCEPGYVRVGNAEIYCDGRQWNGTAPYCRDSNAIAPTSCDFEKDGFCWWEQDPKHDFDWIRHRFETPSSHIGTGPTYDHTLGFGKDGYYLYIEASGRLVNDTARILSPLYRANLTDSGCFSFWYHMYGATIGSLNVYFKSETEKTARLMWSKNGNQGNHWLHGLFELPTVNNSFQIIIEGVRGLGYVSDMAVDDVAILQGDECDIKNMTVTVTNVPPNSDELEAFNGIQSCRDRCVNSFAYTSQGYETYSTSDLCECTLDCADNSTCCPDYAEYCIYEVLEQTETSISISNDTSTPTVTNSQTQKKVLSSATTKYEETTKFKIPSTTSGITTAPTIRRTNAETRLTSRSPMRTSTHLTTMAVNVETPFFVPVRETKAPNNAQTDSKPLESDSGAAIHNVVTKSQVIIQHTRQFAPAANLTGIIGIVIGILTGVTIATVVALVILRKRYSYKRGSNGSAFSEDSDVRFLTSDEMLDFNLARPAGEFEEL